jgi:hypothetical protein
MAALLLVRLGSIDWRQPAGLLVVLRGRLGDGFAVALADGGIGAEGIEGIEQLLRRYGEGEQAP